MEGNDAFKAGDLTLALRKYHEVLLSLKGLDGQMSSVYGSSQAPAPSASDSFPLDSLDGLAEHNAVLAVTEVTDEEAEAIASTKPVDSPDSKQAEVKVSRLPLFISTPPDFFASRSSDCSPQHVPQLRGVSLISLSPTRLCSGFRGSTRASEDVPGFTRPALMRTTPHSVYIKQERWQRALDAATSAKKYDEDNAKALFREGQARIGLGEVNTGKRILEDLQVKNGPDAAITAALQKLAADEKKREQAKNAQFRGMFNRKNGADQPAKGKPVGESSKDESAEAALKDKAAEDKATATASSASAATAATAASSESKDEPDAPKQDVAAESSKEAEASKAA